jgi:hypothetical protein
LWSRDIVLRLVAQLSLVAFVFGWTQKAMARVHTAPFVVPGSKILSATHYPVSMYRLYRTDATGKAVPIPFQIDEINQWGDFVLPNGGPITANTGNGIFDAQDELAFMGEDVGPVEAPTKWDGTAPTLVFEIRVSYPGKNPAGPNDGAVYLAVFFQPAPELSPKKYVHFDAKKAEIITSRYRYGFDPKNWLVARRVEMKAAKAGPDGAPPPWIPLLESTTFFMRADLKYFLTVEANHRSVDSQLEAYKIGPVRSIVRISFHYTFLRLNFELGMYTEVSFFSNAVYLPAIMYNPIDGRKSLNRGSGFYYGMAMRENPKDIKIESNMPQYESKSLLPAFGKKTVEPLYWVAASAVDRLLYVEIIPSLQMRENGAAPMLYREEISGEAVKSRRFDTPGELGSSPVNMALYFDLTKFTEGEHLMAFKLYFDNINEPERLASFRELGKWDVNARRIRQ